jgi:hypothetical protein
MLSKYLAYLSRFKRADERTRTADLLITSDNWRVAGSSRVVQNACKPALIYLQLPSATSGPTLPVVSEWYQRTRGYQAILTLKDRCYAGS